MRTLLEAREVFCVGKRRLHSLSEIWLENGLFGAQ